MFLGAVTKQFASRGGEIGAIVNDRPISYREMDDDVRSLGQWLAAAGLEPGDTVGLTIRDEYRHLIASVALMRLGCIQVTLPSHEPPEHRQAIAERTKAIAVLTEDPGAGVPTLPTILADFGYRADRGPFPETLEPGDDRVCMYLTSSGTTGRIKIIPTTATQLFHQAQTWQWPAQRDVFYRPTSIEYNNSKRQRLYNLTWATTNVFADAKRTSITETCRRWDVTRLNISAVQTRTLIDQATDGRALSPACHIRLGGSAISPQLRQAAMDKLTPNVHVTYATSEFGSIATAGPEHHGPQPETVGLIHPGIQLQIVDDDGRPVGPDRPGRIRVRGPGMVTGYFGDEEATAKAFSAGWFYPGDVGHLSKDGLLFLDGRSDDMIILASINIFPAEIERVVESIPGVVECAAFSIKSGTFGDIPLLAAVVSDQVRAPDIAAFARKRLGLRAPRKVFLVDSLPRNSGGKIDRRVLQARFSAGSSADVTELAS
jgi:acyl-coenzyme A synthetase/AMP-(fatty) acid ligase